jgi:hypothetical protein
MPFTGRDCINTAATYNDEPIDEALAIPAINRALGILGGLGLVILDVPVNALAAKTYYATHPNATSIIRVLNSDKDIYLYWQADDPREIQFKEAGSYTVRVNKLADEISGIDTPIGIHPAFKQVIVSFLIGFAKLEDDDSNPDGQKNLEQTFKEGALKVYSELMRGTKHRSTAFTVRRR